MSEPNPYEAPQSDPTSAPRDVVRPIDSSKVRICIQALIGLQLVAAVLSYAFDIMQALAHSGFQKLQTISQFCLISFIGIGLLLLLIAIIRRSLLLLFAELLAILIGFWLSLPVIQ